jgi:uncharacterized protein YecE (DUF72 family)
VEINGTHYSLQKPKVFQAWYDATPPGFIFSLKGSRFITHLKQLKDVEVPLANFFASGVLLLREKLGPFLWQFSPRFRFRPERMEAFFKMLPRNSEAAARLARKHDPRVDPACTRPCGKRTLRHCVEIRHASFMVSEFFELLREHRIGFVLADSAGKFPYSEDVTSDFVYIRLHGAEELYVSGYTPEALAWWANRVRTWARGRMPRDAKVQLKERPPVASRDVFVYFDNDAKVKAPEDAMALRATVESEGSKYKRFVDDRRKSAQRECG